jgi:hypothetical protein
VKVTFHSFGDHLASSRYRALIPQRFFDKGSDVLVIGKHGWTWEAKTEGFAHVVLTCATTTTATTSRRTTCDAPSAQTS